MKISTYILAFIVTFIAGGLVFRSCDRPDVVVKTVTQSDTVRVRDTIHPPIPKPIIVEVVRYDTVRVSSVDTVSHLPADDTILHVTPDGKIIIPIAQKTYTTEDYRAIIEGYRSRLVDIEVYPITTTITNTITNTVTKSKRWAFTVGPGVGYGPKGIQPYIGAHFGFVLWSF